MRGAGSTCMHHIRYHNVNQPFHYAMIGLLSMFPERTSPSSVDTRSQRRGTLKWNTSPAAIILVTGAARTIVTWHQTVIDSFQLVSFSGRLLPAHEGPIRWKQHWHSSTSNGYWTHPLDDSGVLHYWLFVNWQGKVEQLLNFVSNLSTAKLERGAQGREHHQAHL
jgi:hypothetical protein